MNYLNYLIFIKGYAVAISYLIISCVHTSFKCSIIENMELINNYLVKISSQNNNNNNNNNSTTTLTNNLHDARENSNRENLNLSTLSFYSSVSTIYYPSESVVTSYNQQQQQQQDQLINDTYQNRPQRAQTRLDFDNTKITGGFAIKGCQLLKKRFSTYESSSTSLKSKQKTKTFRSNNEANSISQYFLSSSNRPKTPNTNTNTTTTQSTYKAIKNIQQAKSTLHFNLIQLDIAKQRNSERKERHLIDRRM